MTVANVVKDVENAITEGDRALRGKNTETAGGRALRRCVQALRAVEPILAEGPRDESSLVTSLRARVATLESHLAERTRLLDIETGRANELASRLEDASAPAKPPRASRRRPKPAAPAVAN